MSAEDKALPRRRYLALAGGAFAGFAGCQGGGEETASPQSTAAPPTTENEGTRTQAGDGESTDASTPASFPVPPAATESDLRYVMDLSRMRPEGGRNDMLMDLLFFVNAPDRLDPRGFEVDSASRVLSWYDERADGWTLEAEERVQVSGSFAKDEMSPGGSGLRGRPNVVRRYRAGDWGAFVWVLGGRRPGSGSMHSLVLATGPWEQVAATAVDLPKQPFGREDLPRFLTANVCDVGDVVRISKFRAGYGHSHTADFESCRTMKHYVHGGPDVEVAPRYAPVSGTVHQIMDDGPDQQLFIVPDDHPEFVVRQEHLVPADGIDVGTHVEAGQHVGDWHAELFSDAPHAIVGEIIVHMRTPEGTALVSMFDLLTDEAFAEWVEHGGPDAREDYIIPKARRDANPMVCGDDEFYEGRQGVDETTEEYHEWSSSEANFVYLD